MNLVLCERYSTKMTAGACEKFKANTPDRCSGCAGPLIDAKLDGPVVLATPVHTKRKSAPLVVDYAKRNAKSKDRKREITMSAKKKAECLGCKREMIITGRGLCGGCYNKELKAETLETNYPTAHWSARDIKEGKAEKPTTIKTSPDDLHCGPVLAAEEVWKKVEDSDTVSFHAFSSLNRFSSSEDELTAQIFLCFEGPADRIIFEDLTIAAKKNRRSIDQEILFRLEMGVK